MWTGWAKYAGIVFSYEEQTLTYARNGLKSPTGWHASRSSCPALSEFLGTGFNLPDVDNAPWVNEFQPESRLFAGVVINDVDGLDGGMTGRATQGNSRDGGTLGPLRHGPRPVAFDATLIGRTENAVKYGLNWLSAVLAGNAAMSDSQCALGDFEFYESCPPQGPIRVCAAGTRNTTRVSYRVPTTFPTTVATDCDGWVIDGSTHGTACQIAIDAVRVTYPVLGDLIGQTGITDVTAAATGSLIAQADDIPWHGIRPDFAGYTYLPYAAGDGATNSVTGQLGHFRSSVIQKVGGTPGEIVDQTVDVNFFVNQGEGNVGLTMWHGPTQTFVPITSVSGPDPSAYELFGPLNEQWMGINTENFLSLTNYDVQFDAAGLDVTELELIWWALNPIDGAGNRELITDTSFAYQVQQASITHGGGVSGSGWFVDGVNVDGDPANSTWTTPAQQVAFMNANDPYGNIWTLSGNDISAIVVAAQGFLYGELKGTGGGAGESSTASSVVVGEAFVCPMFSSAADLIDWMNDNDPSAQVGRQWALDGAGNIAIDYEDGAVPPGYGVLTACTPNGDIAGVGQFITNDVISTVVGLDDGTITLSDNIPALWRSLKNVGLLKGPTIRSAPYNRGDLHYLDVEFTMMAEQPHIHTVPVVVAGNVAFDQVQRTPFNIPQFGAFNTYTPSYLLNPLYPGQFGPVTQPAYNVPANVWQTCIDLFNPSVSDSMVPLIDIQLGGTGLDGPSMFNMKVHVFAVLPGDPSPPGCGSGNNDFFVSQRRLGAIEIPELPHRALLSYDGRDNSALLGLVRGNVIAGSRYITGHEGGGLPSLIVPPGRRFRLVFEADAQNTNNNTRVTVKTVMRKTIA